MAECQQRGAKRAIALKVSAPFHCALMMPAQEGMTVPLHQATFSNLQIPLVNNVDAAIVHSGDEARTGVIRQISSPVRWTASVERIIAEGVDTFIEVGPGKVLCGLIKSVNRSVKLLNVENRESLESVLHS
jgi:[acyl-carrier-protein] S-malonyltransferase